MNEISDGLAFESPLHLLIEDFLKKNDVLLNNLNLELALAAIIAYNPYPKNWLIPFCSMMYWYVGRVETTDMSKRLATANEN